MQPSLFSSCSGKTGCNGLEENTAGRQVGLELEDVTRGHPGREELEFQARLERCGERAFVEAGDPGGNRLHPDFMRLRDGGRHQSRAERGVKNAAGPDRAVSLDHDVAHGLGACPRVKEPRTFDGREEVALVGIAAGLPERTIESRRQVACPRCRGPGRSNLSELETANGRLRRLALDVVQDRAREHAELRIQRLGAEVEGRHDATDGPALGTGRVERAREHLPPDAAALRPGPPEELREEVRLAAQDGDRIAHDPPFDDGDMVAIRVRRERVAEEREEIADRKARRPLPLAAGQVPEGAEAQSGAGDEISWARGADADVEARLDHMAGWFTED